MNQEGPKSTQLIPENISTVLHSPGIPRERVSHSVWLRQEQKDQLLGTLPLLEVWHGLWQISGSDHQWCPKEAQLFPNCSMSSVKNIWEEQREGKITFHLPITKYICKIINNINVRLHKNLRKMRLWNDTVHNSQYLLHHVVRLLIPNKLRK